MEAFPLTYYNNGTVTAERSALYGDMDIATPDNRYITVQHAASSEKSIVL